ncbi:monocarboxylate transporter 12 [Trichonephila clavata]|uniref:Monocarboxylate transporter 12 n=1 Tax=Trichonephila clavata TaxID=2740835 RepID=A0A8X6G2E5_TRICU|nr:monocarboxylate transporter 12 [Trichonephila clavata]
MNFSMRYFCHLICPVVGYLGCQFGLQRITIIGCFLSSIAIGACFFAEHIHIITLCYGILFGFGYSMANNLLPSILNHHYNNDFMTANGVSLAGSSLGALAYVPFYDYILNMYGLSGSFFILSAFILNTVPAAMLLKMPDKKNDSIPVRNGENLIGVVCTNKNEAVSSPDHCQTTENSHCSGRNDKQPVLISRNDQFLKHNCQISQQTSDTVITLQKTKLPEQKENNQESLLTQHWEESPPARTMENSFTKEMQCNNDNTLNCLKKIPVTQERKNKEENSSPVISSGTQQYITCCDCSTEVDIQAKQPPIEINRPILIKKIKKNNSWKAFSLFFNPLFLIISYIQSSFLVFSWIMFTVEVDFAVDIGVNRSNGKYILMIEALCNFIGRISMGWVVDKQFLSVSNFSAVMFFIFGLSALFISFSSEICGLIVSLAFLGSSVGILGVLSPVMASEFFQGDKKVFAVASRYILFVPLSFIIPPLIGFFREGLGSYILLFYFVAGGCFLSSILSLLLPKIAKCLQDNNPHH